jgi:hypothetical protein
MEIRKKMLYILSRPNMDADKDYGSMMRQLRPHRKQVLRSGAGCSKDG